MQTELKVAQVTSFFSGVGGGAIRAIADHILAVRTQGIRTVLFAGAGRNTPITSETLGLEDCEIVASPIPFSTVMNCPWKALQQLARRADEFAVIHVNGAWNLTAFVACLIARRRHVPCIFTAHSHLGEYHQSRNRQVKALLTWLERLKIRWSYAVHTTSNWENHTSRRFLAHARQVLTIPYAVEFDKSLERLERSAARRELGLDPDSFLVVHFGRLARQKNLEFLLDAFLGAELPENARLAFVGPPERALKERLVQKTADAGAGSRVLFVDYVSGRRKSAWLSAGDVFALPSWDENFCIAALEAGICGTHALLSPHVGVTEYLPRDAFTVLPLDLAAWTDKLEALSLHRPPQQRLPESCLKQFELTTVGRRWSEVYAGITRGRERR